MTLPNTTTSILDPQLQLLEYRIQHQLEEYKKIVQANYPGVIPYFAYEWMPPETKRQYLTSLLTPPTQTQTQLLQPTTTPNPFSQSTTSNQMTT